MQGSPDDVLEAVVKRGMLLLTTRQLGKEGQEEEEGMLAWVRKVQTLRETENQKSAMGRGRKTKFSTPPSKGVYEYGESR